MSASKKSHSNAFYRTPGGVRLGRYRIWDKTFGRMSVVHNNRMWLIGGDSIWNTKDGRLWNRIADYPDGMPRFYSAVYSYDGKIWIVAGYTAPPATVYNSVWSSEDGIEWTEVNDDAAFSDRRGVMYWVYDGKMWLANGNNLSGFVSPTWYNSTDGDTWTNTYSSTGSALFFAASCVHDSKMYHSGGRSGSIRFGTVFYSTDGATFTDAGKSHDEYWGRRDGHSMVSFHDNLVVIGGTKTDTTPIECNDVWISTDGDDWEQIQDDAPWPARRDMHAWVFDDRIWIAGGEGGGIKVYNDIWYSDDGIKWRENI